MSGRSSMGWRWTSPLPDRWDGRTSSPRPTVPSGRTARLASPETPSFPRSRNTSPCTRCSTASTARRSTIEMWSCEAGKRGSREVGKSCRVFASYSQSAHPPDLLASIPSSLPASPLPRFPAGHLPDRLPHDHGARQVRLGAVRPQRHLDSRSRPQNRSDLQLRSLRFSPGELSPPLCSGTDVVLDAGIPGPVLRGLLSEGQPLGLGAGAGNTAWGPARVAAIPGVERAAGESLLPLRLLSR